jgi:hypothetical protein
MIFKPSLWRNITRKMSSHSVRIQKQQKEGHQKPKEKNEGVTGKRIFTDHLV